MAAAALVVSILALVVSVGSLVFTRRQATASERQASVARNQDLRDRTPKLDVALHEMVGEKETTAVYRFRNGGPQDLDSVIVKRPRTADGVHYKVASLGGDFGDEAELGPIELGHDSSLVLAIGPAEHLPKFVVRVVCRSGEDTWESSVELKDPRFHVNVF